MTAAPIFEATASAIRARFRDEVATPEALTTVYDNQESPAVTSRWCRLSVEINPGTQVGTGSANSCRFRATGRMVAQLFEPLGAGKTKGDGAQWAIVDAIETAFRRVRLTTPFVTFRAGGPMGPAEVDSETWWRRRVEIPFYVDYVGASE